jgi:chemotaxis protein MotB
MAWVIDRHRFQVTLDGHTRADLKLDKPDYSSWELSTDRANAARRQLVYYAVDPTRIERVTGYGESKPLPGEDPASESNQRVTLNLNLSAKRGFKDNKLVDQPIPVTAPESPLP